MNDIVVFTDQYVASMSGELLKLVRKMKYYRDQYLRLKDLEQIDLRNLCCFRCLVTPLKAGIRAR